MKYLGGAFRTMALVGMRISEKMEPYGRGGTELNRMQVEQTENSKKILWTDGNNSDSPHLRAKSSCCRGLSSLWSIKEREF